MTGIAPRAYASDCDSPRASSFAKARLLDSTGGLRNAGQVNALSAGVNARSAGRDAYLNAMADRARRAEIDQHPLRDCTALRLDLIHRCHGRLTCAAGPGPSGAARIGRGRGSLWP